MSERDEHPFWSTCRGVAVGLVARAWPGMTATALEDRVESLPPAQQSLFVGGVIACLFAAAVIAAQFGWVGMAVYFAVVIFLVG